jgi:DNA-binding NarL/FixJ family response regulator
MDAAERYEILSRYEDRTRRFEEIASQRRPLDRLPGAEVTPLQQPRRDIEQPTKRELEVLQLIAEGLTNAEIGKRLCLTEETARSHVRNLLAALGVHSRAHALAVGFRRGIIA